MFKWNEDTKIKKIETWFLKTIQTCNKDTKIRQTCGGTVTRLLSQKLLPIFSGIWEPNQRPSIAGSFLCAWKQRV